MSIYDAFATAVGSFAAGRSLPVGYPGVHFTPPASGAWLEVRWFPSEPQNYGTSDSGPTLLQGFGQVSVCYRPGSGIVGGLELAEAVIVAFPKGTRLGIARVERKPWISAALEADERVSHPVTVPWRGFTT